MAAGSTYTPIATTTLGASQTVVTFSSIPSTYTDLIVVLNAGFSTAAAIVSRMTFNSDTATNYSQINFYGTGSTFAGSRATNQSSISVENLVTTASAALRDLSIIQIMNYSNSTTYKPALVRQNNNPNGVVFSAGVWRSASAINSVTLTASSSTYISGSTFTLYGIAAA